VDNQTFLSIEGSTIEGKDILTDPIDQILERIELAEDKRKLIQHEFERFKTINDSKKFDKNVEEWTQEDLVEFLSEMNTLSDSQLDLVKQEKLDGMDLMTHF